MSATIYRYYELDKLSRMCEHAKIGITGGYFDPLHYGHIELIRDCKQYCDFLIVAINNDVAAFKKKGYYFFPIDHRLKIVSHLEYPSVVLEVNSTNMVEVLEKIKPTWYFKGGDVDGDNILKIESDICEKIGCEIKYGIGGNKNGSSSVFFKEAMKQYNESIYTQSKSSKPITSARRITQKKLS